MNAVIAVNSLEKSYAQKKAVNGIDIFIQKGEIVGLLGPNGAGKSTTINILATVLAPDGGRIEIAGHNLKDDKKEIKKLLGIVPQDLAIYEEISAEKNVRFFASLYGATGKKLDEQVTGALKIVGLNDRRKDKPKTFSGGMKRRLNIACAIAHQPEIIIMDEPTVGIDPQSRNHILDSIIALRDDGATIIYSTHYMEEVEAIADRVLILNDGIIIASGTKEEICKNYENQVTYTFRVNGAGNLTEGSFSHISGVCGVDLGEEIIAVTIKDSGANLNDIVAVFIDNDCTVMEMNSEVASLETVFLDLTGKKLRD